MGFDLCCYNDETWCCIHSHFIGLPETLPYCHVLSVYLCVFIFDGLMFSVETPTVWCHDIHRMFMYMYNGTSFSCFLYTCKLYENVRQFLHGPRCITMPCKTMVYTVYVVVVNVQYTVR